MNFPTETEIYQTFGKIHKPNYKTQLCKNYGRLGCGHCRYGPKRQFIHPEDPAYLDMYPDTWHFAKEQEAHSQYVQALHNIRASSAAHCTCENVADSTKSVRR
ncbi:Protein CBG20891 [Caenorhabditis briggsae]|uniref:Protein CBG20891 n=1 Tax=Caenorhabditis briggsae TaxID=6238 RepID=A8XYV9_CAEBR|nr:Protein CBG20891 [Caenorhabditis briggsae]CAP37826.2 Protein CBG20891 [Caenorhabditis briggsae]